MTVSKYLNMGLLILFYYKMMKKQKKRDNLHDIKIIHKYVHSTRIIITLYPLIMYST